MFRCSACNRSWNRSSDLSQHYTRTTNPECKRAGEIAVQALRHSSSAPRRDVPSFWLETQNGNANPNANPHLFQGDFFGQDYSTADFPGFEGDGNQIVDEEDDHERNSGHEAPELEQTWEPPRAPASIPNEIDADENSVPASPQSTLLHSLPGNRQEVHVDHFGGRAGAPLSDSSLVRLMHDSADGFRRYQANLSGSNENIWAPFNSQMDWEVARWAKMRGTGSTAFSDLLAIDGVHEALGLSYRNSDELHKIIDSNIPIQRPSFTRAEVVIAGEAFDLYKRNILDCIRALYGSPEHAQYLCITPERHYSDADKTCRLYHDIHTGKWWWNTQKALEQQKPGATVVPVILSSDKTQVTLFRNKSAYPVYLTIGNLPKEIRRKPSQQGQILLGYLPTTKLDHIKNKASRRRTMANLFHACMSHLVAPLKSAGQDGVPMESGDGVKCRCHPILAAYVADYPEQILTGCAFYGDCGSCECPRDELGDYPCCFHRRNHQIAVDAVKLVGTDEWIEACREANIKPVQHPFWENLPYTDIFRSITPDVLHQLYQGVMKHLIDEIDARVRRLPLNHGIRHFHKGISTLSRVTGAEHKQICALLLGLIIDTPSLSAHQSKKLVSATRSLLDFLYLARCPIHNDNTLLLLEAALQDFHDNKSIFITLHAPIRYYGTTDNYSTETTERLHINFAKDAYRASNKKDEYAQMTKWLERREKIMHHSNYIDWRCSQLLMASIQNNTSSCSSTPGQRIDFPGAQRTLSDFRCLYMQKLTKYPTVKTITLQKLEDTSSKGYGAVKLRHALSFFIAQYRNPTLTSHEVEEMSQFISLPFTSVPVWHQIKFVNSELYGDTTLDFDTALIQTTPNNPNNGYLDGMCVGRVRVIFSLPSKGLDRLFPSDISPPTHLAYVEWFTKFTRQLDPSSGMHRLKRQVMSDGSLSVSVIPVEMIKQSVHLFPKWGGTVPSDWTCENVLDVCPTFLLNPFCDLHTYCCLL
ncbi:hypothetical protein K435DRAFT_817339 [Dendrothele bispora CBS 962.96]|uniref:C2H2-type domain-containing protein n=1 Tax=Dendrothele bispora (strain CBS 962.96) TaxID=1314807 RepID=A0A4S8MKZ2_DENBC|nr:hypothetical protein K435DRAFT_817339 [Dendrothele bispora CBS 962.96]